MNELPMIEPTNPKRGILDLPREELLAWLESHRQPAMRIKQIWRWLFEGRVTTFEQMTDLPLGLRERLQEEFVPLATSIARRLVSEDGTQKLLLRLHDGKEVECVLLPEENRRTACISTQVGCGMGCVFCASGIGGVERNLTLGEMLEQMLQVRNLLPQEERLTHIVVMGMGEPLANFDVLMESLSVATSPKGLGIGSRHITVSTVGLPTKIRQFADLKKQYHLAVSLHAPHDTLRNEIVPTNDKTGMKSILEAADYFLKETGRQVTYEYVLLRDVNDRPEHASELARTLRGRKAHVNLIPFNDVEGLPYRRLSKEALAEFQDILQRGGVSSTVRKRKGADIDAACGQLRHVNSECGMRNPE